MKAETLTERIYQQADNDLKRKIDQSLDWIWKETGHTTTKPDDSQLAEINDELRGTANFSEFTSMPWIGAAIGRLKVITFHYLRNKYRNQAMTDFINKVKSVDEIINNLPQ